MLFTVPMIALAFGAASYRAQQFDLRQCTVWAQAAAACLAAVLVMQAAYGFYLRPVFPPDEEWLSESLPDLAPLVLRVFPLLSHFVPSDLMLGAFFQLRHNQIGHPGFLLGSYSLMGWWYYFPVAFALKAPLPFLLASAAGIAWCGYRALALRDPRCMFVLTGLVAYVALVAFSRINIGVRYFIPAYAVLFIIAGAYLDHCLRSARRRVVTLSVVAATFGWMGIEAVRAYPDHVPYMNQIAAGRPHWALLSDSNVEWGDDVRGLAEYLHARGESRVRSAVMGGPFLLPHYNIENLDLVHPEQPPSAKTTCTAIGASFLNGTSVPGRVYGKFLTTRDEWVNRFADYRRRRPEAVIGGSIFVYCDE
jgi:hypothetical protein